jgi:hypothetical protein
MISLKGYSSACAPCNCCTQEPASKKKKFANTPENKQCCSHETDKDLVTASMFINFMSVIIKLLGNQVRSLKEENTTLRKENAVLRNQLDVAA